MSFRAKFKVSSIELMEGQQVLKAKPVVSGSEENKSFNKYTPCGYLILYVSKDTSAYGSLQPGQEFYMDITPIEHQ